MTKFYAKEIYDFVLTILAILRQFSSRIILFYCIFFLFAFQVGVQWSNNFRFRKNKRTSTFTNKTLHKIYVYKKYTLYIFYGIFSSSVHRWRRRRIERKNKTAKKIIQAKNISTL